jgi:3-hydroxyisobutyrate dehydrogenase-like beta-hydroxyacid dehydrogenase
VRGVIGEVRDTLYDLRTDVNDEHGFGQVIASYAERVRERSKDLTYYTALATQGGFRSGLAKETMAVFDKAVAAGHGEKRLSRLLDPKLNQD